MEVEEQSVGTWSDWHSVEIPLRLGVSSCLLGQMVRFDGGHARDRFVSDILDEWVDWVPVCPEMEIGMGAPRPTIRLVGTEEDTRLIEPESGRDYTDEMRSFARKKTKQLDDLGLDGYVLKKASPSCGLERVKLYSDKGMPSKKGVGVFTAALVEAMPMLPIEEDGRLNDPHLRENFIERIFVRNRWRALVAKGLDRRRLVGFHTAHKLLIWSHDEAGMRRLGRLLGSAGSIPDRDLFEQYERELYAAMTTKATRKRHTNVLQHAFGYFKTLLDERDKRTVLTAIEDYRLGLLPLIVPTTLLRFNITRFDVEYLKGQLYFDPHPKELLLRNHV